MKEKSWIIILFTIFIFSGCEDREYNDSSSNTGLVSAYLQLSVDKTIPGYSRAFHDNSDKYSFSGKDNVSRANEVFTRQAQLYQFDQSGACYYKSEPFTIDLSYGVPAVLQTRLRAGQNQNVWLFVATTISQLPDLQNESQIDQLSYKYDKFLKGDELPFYASQQHIDIISETQHNLKPFLLNRICSKLIIEYDIDPASGFLLQELRIFNVPAFANYKQQPSQIDSRFISHNEYISGKRGTVTYFIPENNQGLVPSIDEPEQKNIGNAPVDATYIELAGYYKSKKVTFRVYPGANGTNDFNLKRNHWYRILFRITDVFLEDLRVEYASEDEFIIYLHDELSHDYSKVRNILLNNQLWISDFTISGSKVIMNYTSTTGSHLNHISFCDASGKELFGGKVDYHFTTYNQMNFSPVLGAQGNGSSSDPYQVFEAKQLKNLNMMCKLGYSSNRYIQKSDIDLMYFDPNKWQPVGSDQTPFQGTYDGNGYSILNLNINTTATGNNSLIIPRAGLFGTVKNAVIRNLHIREGYIGCKSGSMGAIAASAHNSLIEECSATMKVEQYQRANTGGLVGELIHSELSDCYNASQSEMTAWHSATYYTGGIVGYALDSKIQNVYSVQPLWIGNSYALGAVAGALVDGSVAENIFGEEYKTTGNKIIGNPASTNGLMSSSYLKSAAFVQKLNNGSESGAWRYRSGNYPKLKGER